VTRIGASKSISTQPKERRKYEQQVGIRFDSRLAFDVERRLAAEQNSTQRGIAGVSLDAAD
jgi:hypothetical protein